MDVCKNEVIKRKEEKPQKIHKVYQFLEFLRRLEYG